MIKGISLIVINHILLHQYVMQVSCNHSMDFNIHNSL